MALPLKTLGSALLVLSLAAVPVHAATPGVGTKWKGTWKSGSQYPKQKATLSAKVVKSKGRRFLKGSAKVTTTCLQDTGTTDQTTGERVYREIPGPTFTYRFRVRIRKGGSWATGAKSKPNGDFEDFSGTFTTTKRASGTLRFRKGDANSGCGLLGGGAFGKLKKK